MRTPSLESAPDGDRCLRNEEPPGPFLGVNFGTEVEERRRVNKCEPPEHDGVVPGPHDEFVTSDCSFNPESYEAGTQTLQLRHRIAWSAWLLGPPYFS